jgi:ribonuclease D
MQANVKSFWIRSGSDGAEDEAALAAFLRGVDVLRLETAYDQGWRVLVLYSDMRVREEAKQIRQAIRAALDAWRRRRAADLGVAFNTIADDQLLDDVAAAAPTTTPEMRALLATGNDMDDGDLEKMAEVVRKTLKDLSVPTNDTAHAELRS